eukprot:scaffold79794_cov66-Attheya_sp.AAC.3
MLKIKETDLVKGIHTGMYPHLISERGDKVNAMPPYKSFKFVFVAPEGTTAAGEMSLTLREWTQLCHSLSSDKALSTETKDLFHQYTGRSADYNVVVDEQKANPRFIHTEVLEKMLRDATAPKKNKSLAQATSETSCNSNASRTDGEDESNRKLTCIGLKNVRVQNYVAFNPEYVVCCIVRNTGHILEVLGGIRNVPSRSTRALRIMPGLGRTIRKAGSVKNATTPRVTSATSTSP